MVKYLSFHNSSFALRYFLINVNGKVRVRYTPLFEDVVDIMDLRSKFLCGGVTSEFEMDKFG
jgi:hypothetical protein